MNPKNTACDISNNNSLHQMSERAAKRPQESDTCGRVLDYRDALVDTYQHGQIRGRECSNAGTKVHTHMVVQSDLDLGLAFHHHPWQEHRRSPLRVAPPETCEQSLVERQPGAGAQKTPR